MNLQLSVSGKDSYYDASRTPRQATKKHQWSKLDACVRVCSTETQMDRIHLSLLPLMVWVKPILMRTQCVCRCAIRR